MPNPQAVSARLHNAAQKKNERDTVAPDPGKLQAVSLSQIAEALIAMQGDVADLRIAVEALLLKIK